MEIRLLKDDYLRSERIYIDFMNDQINKNEDNFSGETVFIDEAPDFPVYLNINNNEKRLGTDGHSIRFCPSYVILYFVRENETALFNVSRIRYFFAT